MTSQALVTVQASHGKATRLARGQRVKLVNTHGTQVVDTWAFNAQDLGEFLSMDHCRVAWGRIMPRAGDGLVTNQRRPILSLAVDTSPGIHDTLCAACDRYRYEQLGVRGYHRNCRDNLLEALGEMGLTPPVAPAPLNLFMNIPVLDDRNAIAFRPTVSKPGDHVVLSAELDCVVAFSACPQDIVPINGEARTPVDVHFVVLP